MSRLRILLLTEQNNPDSSSVPLLGFLHGAALAAAHEVTLVTRGYSVPAIVRRNAPFKTVVGIDLPWWDALYDWAYRVIFKSNYASVTLTAFKIPFYLAFELAVWRRYRKQIEAGEFDAVMRLTPVSSALPSYLAWAMRRTATPFVIGPLNGGLPWPKGYSHSEQESEFSQKLRGFYRLMPFATATYRDASAVLCGSVQTWNEHVDVGTRRFFLPENGIDESYIRTRPAQQTGGPLQLVSIGRFVPCKAFDIGIKAAMPLLKAGKAHFTLIGYGEGLDALESLCAELGVQQYVTFTGAMPHAKVIEKLFNMDVMVFPSIRDFGGGVVFEALACGVVPVVTDYGGPGDLVTPEIGLKVPLSTEQGSIDDFTKALAMLEADRPRIAQLSAAGQDYARSNFTWAGKARQTAAVLAWCAGKGARPVMEPPAKVSA